MIAREPKAARLNPTWRLAAMLLLAVLLAGCDSCGDWVSPLGSQACQQQTPRPQ